jgi:nitroreductase
MNIFDVIKNRRSIMPDQYNDSPIKEEELKKILEVAKWAPTHKKN